MTVDDVLLDKHGMTPFGTDSPTHALMGRFGNTFVVNGASDYGLDVTRGEVVRFFLTNVSPARIYNLSFSGVSMKVVAGDAGSSSVRKWCGAW
jgi:FtsP/CotA-like multicopper oxidase with cupredoxin domain